MPEAPVTAIVTVVSAPAPPPIVSAFLSVTEADDHEPPDALASVTHTRRYLTARLRHQPHEVFAVLFLDTRHRVIAYEELFHGTIDGTSVHPRQVVRRALHHNAAALILAHNHPSGVAEPSRADESITLRLKEALALIDVRVIDHFVIGDGQSVSFAERGLL